MYDPVSVDTVLINDAGDLLVGLSDGNVINAGRARGLQGPQGERGLMGMRGEPGKDGVNGAQWYTGVGLPDIGLGVDGDLYLDVSSARLDLYRKDTSGWYVIAYIKGEQGGGVSGGEGSGGSGGNIIVHPSPGEPTTDKDGNVLNEGDLWYDPTTGWLYVYHQNEWVVVAGEPPVLISDFPPDQDYGDHPIQEGTLWFDSLQLALYVAVKDSANNMVWITAIPADRTAVDDTVNPFRPTGFATNGDEITNTTTGIVYKYNAPKKQWIDKAPKMGGAYYQEDAPDPTNENLRPGDLWIDSDTHNLYVWTGDTWSQVNPGCNSNPKVHFQPSAPEGTQHIRGDLWIDSDTNKLFTWNGEIWMEVGASCGGVGTEEFVKIVGDTMTGPLILHDEDGNQAEITFASQAVHKAYVDDQDSKLQQEIINLEEEINNIQASVEGGRWNFTINPSVNSGEFRMSGGSFTQQSQTITIHRQDLAAADHYWSQSEVGHYLEILDQTIGSTNNGLYVITDITKDTGAGQTVFEAELVRGTGSPTNNTSCVIKTFELQGGDPTAYVRKVGDEMSGKLHLQDDQGNPQVIEDDDQAVHKQYVDTMLFGQDRECVELNGGKLCGGEPMPRFYNMPEWSYKQKTATGYLHQNAYVQWWEGAQRWIKYTTQKNGSYYTIKIYVTKTELLEDDWELFIEQLTNSTNTNVRMGMVGVGKKYIYLKQYFSGSSANNNALSGKLMTLDPEGNIKVLKTENGLSGFGVNSAVIDAEGNLGCIIDLTTYSYNSGFTHNYKITGYNAEKEDLFYTNATSYVSSFRGINTGTSLIPTGFMKGFYVVYSDQSLYIWDSTHTKNVFYFDPDDNWRRHDVSDKFWPERSYFQYNSSTGGYSSGQAVRMSIGDGSGPQAYTWITYNQDLKRFYCVKQYSDSGRYTTDGSLGFKVYRSKEYDYENINWATFSWKNLFLFTNGAEEVLDSPNSYCREIIYVAGELVTRTLSGVTVSSGATAGDPIKKHPYGKMWGSVDGGNTWQGRDTEIRDSNGLLVASHYPYIKFASDQAPVPGKGGYLNVYFSHASDTNEEFYNEEGKISSYVARDDELQYHYQRYDLPYNLYTGQQALFWNGQQINLPPEELQMETTELAYAGTDGLSDQRTIRLESSESSVSDGRFYALTFDYDSNINDMIIETARLTTGNYYGMFLTSQFILGITERLPDEAKEIEFYNMSGEFNNQGSNQYNRTIDRSRTAAATFNGVNGVVVLFNYGNGAVSNSNSYKYWRFNLPITLRYKTTFGESGLPILALD